MRPLDASRRVWQVGAGGGAALARAPTCLPIRSTCLRRSPSPCSSSVLIHASNRSAHGAGPKGMAERTINASDTKTTGPKNRAGFTIRSLPSR